MTNQLESKWVLKGGDISLGLFGLTPWQNLLLLGVLLSFDSP